MRDVEERLTATLTAAAGEAPAVPGPELAAGARRRVRVRRRRRGVVLALALVVAGSAVLWGMRSQDPGVAERPRPESGWQTIRQDDARADVPSGWRPVRCEGTTRWAPPVAEPCAGPSLVTFLPAALADLVMGPGVLVRSDVGGAWTGYVPVGDQLLHVTGPERALVRRILATARLDGEPVVDGRRWEEAAGPGLRWEQPRGAAVAVCPGGVGIDGIAVTVQAPTSAVAALVRASVRTDPSATGGAPCRSEEHTVTYDGVGLDVPGAWSRKDCGGHVQVTPGAECAGPGTGGVGAWFLDDATYRPATAEGAVVRSDAGGAVRWSGFVRHGRHAVLVVHHERAAAAALLAQVR